MRKLRTLVFGTALAAVLAATAVAANNTAGPSSSQAPYVLPFELSPSISTHSILTVGDTPAGSDYRLVGIPDGLGAFDNGDGTFTLLANHELPNSAGVARAHGGTGAFVSKWVIDKESLEVQSGSDLIHTVFLADKDGVYSSVLNVTFNRFCSADLPPVSALYHSASGKGTPERIFMDGEESGAEGRALAHVVTGSQGGVSYELPYLGRMAFENSVANPGTGDRTIVAEQDDTTPTAQVPNNGQVYVYAGDKKSSGSPVERAGLTGGSLYGIKVLVNGSGLVTEFSKSDWSAGDTFPFAAVDVSADRKNAGGDWSGAALQTGSVTKGVTGFQRPEDGAWDPNNPSDYYFVTTSNITPEFGRDGHTRLWRLRFADPSHPEQGGTIELLVNGPVHTSVSEFTPGPHMFDNIAVSENGQVFLEEDPGNSPYVAKQWLYDMESGKLVQIGQHDPARFVSGASGFLTQDEESSGVIDASEVLGKGWFIFDTQAHFANGPELVEGGQLQAFHFPPGQIEKLFK
jgi:Bacterial protein of unknown function (DUF839)